MIYTFTLNPSMDYIMDVENPRLGEINRSRSEVLKVGGKGINVSLVLKALGNKSTVCAVTAGCIGEIIKNEIDNMGINKITVEGKGCSRINVKIPGERETAFNGKGCTGNIHIIDSLCENIKSSVDDIIVLSGSVCNGLDSSVYTYIMEKIKGRFVIDAEGEFLLNTLKNKPFLIKPNNEELGRIFDCNVDSFEKAEFYGRKLCSMGAENVIVSMGSMGAVLVNKSDCFVKKAKSIKAVNTVGAGDAMVAGFISGYIYKSDIEFAFSEGVRAAELWLMGKI